MACLIAIAVRVFSAAGNEWFTAVGAVDQARQPGRLPGSVARGTRSAPGTGRG
jgi:hypothetical protein